MQIPFLSPCCQLIDIEFWSLFFSFYVFQFPLYYIILVSSVDTNSIVMEIFYEINWHVLRTEEEQGSREQQTTIWSRKNKCHPPRRDLGSQLRYFYTKIVEVYVSHGILAYAAIVLGVRNRMLSKGLKMASVSLDLCLDVAQSLKHELYLVILFNAFSGVNALQVPSITCQKSTQRKC